MNNYALVPNAFGIGTRFAIGLLEVAKGEFGLFILKLFLKGIHECEHLAQHWNTVKRPGVWSVA